MKQLIIFCFIFFLTLNVSAQWEKTINRNTFPVTADEKKFELESIKQLRNNLMLIDSVCDYVLVTEKPLPDKDFMIVPFKIVMYANENTDKYFQILFENIEKLNSVGSFDKSLGVHSSKSRAPLFPAINNSADRRKNSKNSWAVNSYGCYSNSIPDHSGFSNYIHFKNKESVDVYNKILVDLKEKMIYGFEIETNLDPESDFRLDYGEYGEVLLKRYNKEFNETQISKNIPELLHEDGYPFFMIYKNPHLESEWGVIFDNDITEYNYKDKISYYKNKYKKMGEIFLFPVDHLYNPATRKLEIALIYPKKLISSQEKESSKNKKKKKESQAIQNEKKEIMTIKGKIKIPNYDWKDDVNFWIHSI